MALTIGVLILYFLNLPEGIDEARASAFMAIIIFELVRLVNIRSDYKISWLSNVWLPIAILSSVVLQLAIVYIPTLANLFEVAPIDTFDWIYIVVVAISLFIAFRLFDGLLDRVTDLAPAKQSA